MRKSIKYFCICFAIVFSFQFISAQVFEGVIVLETENTEAEENSHITWYIKGEKQRMDYTMTTTQGTINMSLYMQPGSNSVTMVSGGQKQVVDISSNSVNPYLENIIVITPQQENKDVAGFSTRKYTAKGTNSTIDLFITSQLNLTMPVVFSAKGIWKALRENGIGGLPLELSARNNQGKMVFTQRVVSVESKGISDADVTP